MTHRDILTNNPGDIIQLGTISSFKDTVEKEVGFLDYHWTIVIERIGRDGFPLVSPDFKDRSGTLTLRLVTGSSEDKYLYNEITSYLNDPSSYSPIEGRILQRVGGYNRVTTTYKLSGGVVKGIPALSIKKVKNKEVVISEWTLSFCKIEREVDTY